jgi:uncharacterized protein
MLYPVKLGEDPLYPREEDFVITDKDKRAGKGVLSLKPFNKGDIVAKMSGHLVTEVRQHTLQVSATLHNFDPYFSGYFLHSCDPNIELYMTHLLVMAVKDIPANSFLYMDYSTTEDFLFKAFPCSCGADNCRGFIRGRLEGESNAGDDRFAISSKADQDD